MSPHMVEMCCSTHWDVILLDIDPSSLQAILTIGARGMWMNHGGHKKKGRIIYLRVVARAIKTNASHLGHVIE